MRMRKPLNLAKFKVPKGKVVIFAERCKGCKLCIEYCPKEILELSHDYNEKGYHYPVVKLGMENECILCLFCQEVCPDFAIFIEKQE
ncbi:4Fe-S ferredoxin [Candidatus Desulfofervidus auxilii]|uniref:4Fe-S ferredoxin n=2 Tax=Desulfofervidus auxilii TaxID=1621989 RepID=A0A7U4THP7_DESA2|nr:4Fe-S ferredoxin [Candidatus Desulfofervidus auxilii]